MSILFLADGVTVWNPSNTPGQLFKCQAEAAAHALGLPSGLGELTQDEVAIDLPIFERFVAKLAEQYQNTGHYIIRSLIAGVLGPSYVMAERAGGQLPEIDPQRVPGWDELQFQFSRSMPR
jgi:hypothetical protein